MNPETAARIGSHQRAAAAALVALLAVTGAAPRPASAAEAETETARAARLNRQAGEAYGAGEHAECQRLYTRAAEAGRGATAFYNAACCAALGGRGEAALVLLGRATEAGFRDTGAMRRDADLAALHELPGWTAALAAVEAAEARFTARVQPELYRMYVEDQADRHQQPIDWSVVSQRDEERRRRAAELIAAGELEQPEDYLHAAMVFQHGTEPADYERARDLARRAAEMDPDLRLARWLSAAAHDRWLHSRGEPQIYGTQFRRGEDGVWTLEPLDPDAVSDAERAALGVPPLAEARARAEQMNGGG